MQTKLAREKLFIKMYWPIYMAAKLYLFSSAMIFFFFIETLVLREILGSAEYKSPVVPHPY